MSIEREDIPLTAATLSQLCGTLGSGGFLLYILNTCQVLFDQVHHWFRCGWLSPLNDIPPPPLLGSSSLQPLPVKLCTVAIVVRRIIPLKYRLNLHKKNVV